MKDVNIQASKKDATGPMRRHRTRERWCSNKNLMVNLNPDKDSNIKKKFM